MCRHSSVMTEETCADCLREAAERPETLPAPIHEGMDELKQAGRRLTGATMSAHAEAQRIYDEYLASEVGGQRWENATLLYPDYNLCGVDTDNAADFIVEGIAETAGPLADGVEESLYEKVVAGLT